MLTVAHNLFPESLIYFTLNKYMYMATYHIVLYNDWLSKELTFLFVFPGILGKCV